MKKPYKQKYEELLIQKHEKTYLHIPFSWSGIGRFFAVLASAGLAIANFSIIISTWKVLGIGNLDEEVIGSHQLLILYPLVGEYLLIGLFFVCLAAMIKGGYGKLKRVSENGLLAGIILGIILGIMLGITWALFGVLFLGLNRSGFIIGSIVGLTIGIIFGHMQGMEWELEEER